MLEYPGILTTISTATCILLGFMILLDYFAKLKKFQHFPTPPRIPFPLVGHLLAYRSPKNEFYRNMTGRLRENFINKGHEIGCVMFGPSPVIMIVGPNAAEVILKSSKHIDKGFVYKFFHEWLGTGLLTSTGRKWMKRRKLLTPAFHFSILESFLQVMNEQASVLAEKLETYADTNRSVDIFKPITLCALDIICETAMGTKINAQLNGSQSDYVSAVYNMSEFIWSRSRSPWVWWRPMYIMTPNGRKYYKALKTLHTFTQKVIKNRAEELTNETVSSKKRLAFLDLLLRSSEGGKVLNFQDIQEEVDTFMFEGHDTTAAGMSWAIFLIASHLEVQRKVQRELDTVLGDGSDRKISMDDLKRLEYLDLVLKECLRHLPSVPVIGRRIGVECTLDGHQIPAGTECLIFPQLINNLPKYWTDPEKFIPERFLPDNIARQHPYVYIPFSAGQRNCIGQKFALMEEKVVLAHLLRKYTVTACDKLEDLTILGDVILRPGSGINIKLKKRIKSS